MDAQALPPDWARVDDSGAITAAAGPVGTPPRFGLDAARTVLRFQESCQDTDRALAGRTATELVLPPQDTRAVYDLAGNPQVDWQHPLGLSAAAAAADASGQRDRADELLDAASHLDERDPTYYGAAWAALGRVLLRTTLLNDCARTSP
ncbi:hypothetical protein GCM10011609_85830 [Lentzea pudingi]|uniref:Uncharacterized protein n=1 Tax=Lentzea pudingi TaxID=1789439 RepID=A0ABQ2ISG4_9PSEU|nr:hypothetical protein [Lentzea pudingi]GGN29059.1 hypothetical protein GCM10011609_85830 [Lentzea pudingi]